MQVILYIYFSGWLNSTHIHMHVQQQIDEWIKIYITYKELCVSVIQHVSINLNFLNIYVIKICWNINNEKYALFIKTKICVTKNKMCFHWKNNWIRNMKYICNLVTWVIYQYDYNMFDI